MYVYLRFNFNWYEIWAKDFCKWYINILSLKKLFILFNKIGCGYGWYGEGCKQRCDKNCENNTCDSVTGHCERDCNSGWTGHLCNKGNKGSWLIGCTLFYFPYEIISLLQDLLDVRFMLLAICLGSYSFISMLNSSYGAYNRDTRDW